MCFSLDNPVTSRLFSVKNRLVKPGVVTCAMFTTIFVATQEARLHVVTANMPQDPRYIIIMLFVTSTCAT